MSKENKPKLSIIQQIELLKQKGVCFEIYKEQDAYKFLQNNSYFFRLKEYLHIFKAPISKNYENIDFAHLVDLSTIDMHIRRFIIRLSLDIEHTLKTKIMRDFSSSNDDGYEIVNEFLQNNTYTREFLEKNISKIKKLCDNNKDLYLPSQYILHKYKWDLAIWNFVEIVQFGSFLEFANCFYQRYKNLEFNSIKNSLFNIKCLRNAAAHNNCLLSNLNDNIKNPQKQVVDEIFRRKIFKNKGSNYIKNNMKNRVVNDFVVAIFVYNAVCKSTKMKANCFNDLWELFTTRILQNARFYHKNKLVVRRYIFCLKLIKYMKHNSDIVS